MKDEGHTLLERKASDDRGWKWLKAGRPGHSCPFRVLEHLGLRGAWWEDLGGYCEMHPLHPRSLSGALQVTLDPSETLGADAQGRRSRLRGVPALGAEVMDGTTWGGSGGQRRERLVMGSWNPDCGAKRRSSLG